MRLTTNYSICLYDEPGGFLVMIRYNDEMELFEAFLQHKAYGIIEYMFGVSTTLYTLKKFEEIVEEKLAEYMENYAIEYMGV